MCLIKYLNVQPVKDSRDGLGAQPSEGSVEKLMINLDNIEVPRDVFVEKLRVNLDNIEVPENEANLLFTPEIKDDGGPRIDDLGGGGI